MRVINWRRKIATSLVAAGLISPGAAYAVNIPIGDPSFEAYTVPTTGPYANYAYSDLYRPTSAWIDDQGHPFDVDDDKRQDDGDGNWIFNSTYAEATNRAAPRTGNQAMHGRFNYNSQQVANVFEAGKTYTFSMYAQGDSDTQFDQSSVYLYLFDGSQQFTEATSLKFSYFSPQVGNFINRPPDASAAQSKALWQQVSISHTVLPGAPEVGHPIGVGFYGNPDAGFEDASLSVDTTSLTLEVNTANGHVRIVNETGKAVNIDFYQIASAGSSLNKAAWSSLQNQNLAGFPAGNGTGNGWEKAGNSSDAVLAESFLTGNSQIATAGTVGLGSAYAIGDPHDLVFTYGQVAPQSLKSDFDADADVDGSDFLKWQRGLGSFGAGVTAAIGNANTDQTVNADDIAIWRQEFGHTSVVTGVGAQTIGSVRYVTTGFSSATPEPCTVVLAGLGLAGILLFRRRS